MKAKIYEISGKDTGKTVELVDDVYTNEPNDHVVYLDVKQHLANKRQGTHKTKERGEVKGSRAKIKRQKGTGTARAGDIKNPLFRGGGRVFGPKPRNYHFKLNKKVKKLARKSALSYKIKDEAIHVIQDFDFEAPKTKSIVDLKKNLKINDKKTVIVLPIENKNIYLSARNLKDIKVLTVSELNTYNIMNASSIVMTEQAVDTLNKTWA
ncbi:MAG: 50S ribosomal protein L4 [Bacteroidota bacterium]|nr:50S ribosomal protein L4 [Bacteroidota bacterium]